MIFKKAIKSQIDDLESILGGVVGEIKGLCFLMINTFKKDQGTLLKDQNWLFSEIMVTFASLDATFWLLWCTFYDHDDLFEIKDNFLNF